MPLRTYHCYQCKVDFTELVSMSEKSREVCPDCGSDDFQPQIGQTQRPRIKGGTPRHHNRIPPESR